MDSTNAAGDKNLDASHISSDHGRRYSGRSKAFVHENFRKVPATDFFDAFWPLKSQSLDLLFSQSDFDFPVNDCDSCRYGSMLFNFWLNT